MNPRIPRSRVSHDRWLVSYADFITLLFGFFVVLYAFARADQKRQMQVSQAIDSAFHSFGALPDTADNPANSGGSVQPVEPSGIVMGEEMSNPAEVKADLDRLRRDLTQTFSSQIASHAISLEMGRDGLVISLREAGFFDSGSATPKSSALPTLRQIAKKLGATPYDLRIEGHTDNVPQCPICVELGAFHRSCHKHRAALSRPQDHSSRSSLRSRLCRIPSRRR